MQPFSSSFTILLSTIFLALSSPEFVDAVPTAPRLDQRQVDQVGQTHNSSLVRRAPGIVRIPLSSLGEDLAFTSQVNVGTNHGPFVMQMDTGSSDFWVYADVCPQRGTHKFASRATSASMNVSPQHKWGFRYGDGTQVNGIIAQDTLAIGSVQVPSYIFGLLGIIQGPIATKPIDGIVGLGTAAGSRTGVPNFIHMLRQNGVIPANTMSWKLPRRADGGHGGELSIGGPNPNLFDPATEVTVNSINGGFWRVPIAGVKISGVPFAAIAGGRIGTLDTGSTGLVVPLGDAANLNSQFPNPLRDSQTGLFWVPCNAKLQMSLTIGGRDWPIDPRDLRLVDTQTPQGYCMSTIQAGPPSLQGTWIAGGAFLKNVYSTMDFDTNQVKLAVLR
ncbi:acid protease [Dentipellis sp. KUC8613]|nr:acid protease [Dentipellis sp. KUC8613]